VVVDDFDVEGVGRPVRKHGIVGLPGRERDPPSPSTERIGSRSDYIV